MSQVDLVIMVMKEYTKLLQLQNCGLTYINYVNTELDKTEMLMNLKTNQNAINGNRILSGNIEYITHEINKLRLQIREALHIKTKKLKSIELILKIATMFWNAF